MLLIPSSTPLAVKLVLVAVGACLAALGAVAGAAAAAAAGPSGAQAPTTHELAGDARQALFGANASVAPSPKVAAGASAPTLGAAPPPPSGYTSACSESGASLRVDADK